MKFYFNLKLSKIHIYNYYGETSQKNNYNQLILEILSNCLFKINNKIMYNFIIVKKTKIYK